MSENKLAGGVATALAMVTAAGAATLTIGIARNRAEEQLPGWRRQLVEWSGEDPDQAQRDLVVAAATGAAIGMLTYQGLSLLQRFIRERED